MIVFEGDGLTVLAFTTESDAHTGRVAYRFDYRGRSLVAAGDGRAQWANATRDADVVVHGAQYDGLAQLHDKNKSATPFDVASAARASRTAMRVLTGVEDSPVMHDMQIREFDLRDLAPGDIGMMIELPLTNNEVNTRALPSRATARQARQL